MRTGNPDLVRDLNRTLMLNLVREREGISRAELARASGLSPSTVTGIIAELLGDGYLEEVAADNETRGAGRIGRPATALRVNPSAGYVVGVKLAAESMTAMLADLAGEPVVFHGEPRSEGGVEATTAAIAAVVARVAEKGGKPAAGLLGIGVGLPGVIDPDRGVVENSPIAELNGMNVAELLAGRVRVPVHVDNDVNTLTVAEHLFGAGRGARHLAVLSVGRGIGMGLVLNGALYRGRAGGAGEIGHVTVQPNGERCWCGRRGCLETIATEPALVEAVRRRTGMKLRPAELATAAEGDERVAHVLEASGRAVGLVVRNTIRLLDPERIVVSGEGVRLGPRYLGGIEAAISAGEAEGETAPELLHEPWGDEAWARGAASLVLGELFHPAHLPQPQELRPSRRRTVGLGSAVPARAG